MLFFRTATLSVTLDAVLPVQVLGVLSKAFLSYEKLEKQEQICRKHEVPTIKILAIDKKITLIDLF